MSKRRRASEIMFSKSHGLKYPVRVVATLSGTGTVAEKGVITIVTNSSVYLTLTTATNIGTIVGTAANGYESVQ